MPARILIAEDNAANLKLMVYLLKAFGHSTESAHDGEQAMEMIRRETFDLILCDVQMPVMGGYEVARQLKSHPAFRAIPLVAVTALAMVGDRDKVMAAGFDGYIAKPISPQSFVKQVESFLKPQQTPVSAAGTVSTNARLLVVDNSPVNLSLARKTFEPFGFGVQTANSVQEALTLARENKPDLILSDLHMPHQDGFDLIQAVKADPKLRQVPFVFISSTVFQDSDRDRGLELGAVKFLVRPIAPLNLVEEVAACLPKREGDWSGQDPGR